MGTTPNIATEYKCVFKVSKPVFGKDSFPDIYSANNYKNDGISNSICVAYVPKWNEVNVQCNHYRSQQNSKVSNGLAEIQHSCTGHRLKYDNLGISLSKANSITPGQYAAADQYNWVRQLIVDEFNNRLASNKYSSGDKPSDISAVKNTNDITAEQIEVLNKYIACSEMQKDDQKVSAPKPPSRNTTICASALNESFNMVKSLMNDCICYSDCNGYSVCWCYGNCNHY